MTSEFVASPSDDEAAGSHFGIAEGAGLIDVTGGAGIGEIRGAVIGFTTNPVEDMTSGVSGCSFVPPPGVGMMSSGTVWCCFDDVAEDALFTLKVNHNLGGEI